jgi:plastocyanin
MNTKVIFGALGAGVMAVTMAACGGGNGPTGPSNGGGGGGGGAPGPVGATVTFTASGTNSVTVNTGQSVTFVNNDSRARNVSSDPHPVHTDCPPLTVGVLAPGQSRTSNALTTARTCGFHDHDDPDNPNARGQVTIR